MYLLSGGDRAYMMLIFRRKLRTVFKNIVMILMISGVVVTRQIFSLVKENVQ